MAAFRPHATDLLLFTVLEPARDTKIDVTVTFCSETRHATITSMRRPQQQVSNIPAALPNQQPP